MMLHLSAKGGIRTTYALPKEELKKALTLHPSVDDARDALREVLTL